MVSTIFQCDVDFFFFTSTSRQKTHIHREIQYMWCPTEQFLVSRVVFNEVVQTSKYYMRDVTAVESSWLVELAPHFYKQAQVGRRKESLMLIHVL